MYPHVVNFFVENIFYSASVFYRATINPVAVTFRQVYSSFHLYIFYQLVLSLNQSHYVHISTQCSSSLATVKLISQNASHCRRCFAITDHIVTLEPTVRP